MRKHWIKDLHAIIDEQAVSNKSLIEHVEFLFPRDYRDDFTVEEAQQDLMRIDQLHQTGQLQVRLIQSHQKLPFSVKLYAMDHAIPLSDSMPILESMGLRVLLVKPYQLSYHHHCIWLHHFTLQNIDGTCLDSTEKTTEFFEDLFVAVWSKQSENDSFNRLLFSACLDQTAINLFRAYSAYLYQIKFPYSQALIIETLVAFPEITRLLKQLFFLRFDTQVPHENAYNTTKTQYLETLNQIESLDQDLIFKQFLNLIEATLRTNFFQLQHDDYLSFKFDSRNVIDIPEPKPLYEIFVYSSRFEGIHLRGGKVARGGLRWSDRKEDYRTEVLGLMKAQMVKNAIIVPSGSKGGFVTKQILTLPREAQFAEVRQCYQLYISALLELTDNYLQANLQHPAETRIHDQDDPYLVVAADKGTASFSDTANEISIAKGFWLRDAFASGGSDGYDHKKMGITARGAWESVKRHFRVLGKDIQNQNFTVIGIGDMSGDVFGNGMLLSEKILLLAAFNHKHIFVDPKPDAAASYAERKRLFELPRSEWADYDRKLISRGGGVFNRSQKSIRMTVAMKALTGSTADSVSPNELINLILRSQVELLWNGGIGTYVKASYESNEQVKDKSNDAVRINASQLHAKVVGEGGNLGFTQRARIEYAMKGGLLYTDSIDNSAGVDCSDHEVNLKIMFSRLLLKGELKLKRRNQLLSSMQDNVAELCLENNYNQTEIINIILMHAPLLLHEHSRFIRNLESQGVLNRSIEYLPEEEDIVERIAKNQGLCGPELSILLSYSKLTYKDALMQSEIDKEPLMQEILINYFPAKVRSRYRSEILDHPLKLQIIATQLSNQIINRIGPGFGFRMREETGANLVSIARSYMVASKIFETDQLWQSIQALDNQVGEKESYQAMKLIGGLLERTISWLLRNHPSHMQSDFLLERYLSDAQKFRKMIPDCLVGTSRKTYTTNKRHFIKQAFPPEIAQSLAEISILASTFDIVEVRLSQKSGLEQTSKLFFSLAERLQLGWIRAQISETSVSNHWHQLAVFNMRNELHLYQRQLTELILQSVTNKRHTTKALTLWMEKYDYAMNRYDRIIHELQALRSLDFSMASVAVSEVRRLLTLCP